MSALTVVQQQAAVGSHSHTAVQHGISMGPLRAPAAENLEKAYGSDCEGQQPQLWTFFRSVLCPTRNELQCMRRYV